MRDVLPRKVRVGDAGKAAGRLIVTQLQGNTIR
jgi:hypothetical protein